MQVILTMCILTFASYSDIVVYLKFYTVTLGVVVLT